MSPTTQIPGAEMEPEAEEAERTLADFLFIVLRQWKLVGVFAFGAAVLGVVYAFMLKPIYRAEVVVAPATQGAAGGLGGLARFASQFSGLASLAGVDLDTAGTTREIAVATLGSRQLLERFIVDHKLMQRFYASRWDPQTKTFKPGLTGRVPSIDDALKVFNARIFGIVEDRRTGLIRVQISWSNPEEAASWANELVRRVNDSTRATAVMEASRAIEYLTAESQRTQAVGIQQSIFKLIEVQMSKVAMARSRDDYAFRVVDPAVAPAKSNFYWPKRRLVAAVFLAGGIFLGTLFALWRGLKKAKV